MISSYNCQAGLPFVRGSAPIYVESLPGDCLRVHLQRVVTANHISSFSSLMCELGLEKQCGLSHKNRLLRLAAYCRLDPARLEALDDKRLMKLSGVLRHCSACHREGHAPALSGLHSVRICVRHRTFLSPVPSCMMTDAECDGAMLLARKFGIATDSVKRELPSGLAHLGGLGLADFVHGIMKTLNEKTRSLGDSLLENKSDPLSTAWALIFDFPEAFEATMQSGATKPCSDAILNGYAMLRRSLVTPEARVIVASAASRFAAMNATRPLTKEQVRGVPNDTKQILAKLFPPTPMFANEPSICLRRQAASAIAARSGVRKKADLAPTML